MNLSVGILYLVSKRQDKLAVEAVIKFALTNAKTFNGRFLGSGRLRYTTPGKASKMKPTNKENCCTT